MKGMVNEAKRERDVVKKKGITIVEIFVQIVLILLYPPGCVGNNKDLLE